MAKLLGSYDQRLSAGFVSAVVEAYRKQKRLGALNAPAELPAA